MTDRRSHRQQCVNDCNSIRYPVDIDDQRSILHSHHLCEDMLVEWNQNNDRAIFLVGRIFNYEASCVCVSLFIKPPRWATERTTNLVSPPGFPFITFLRMCYLRLFTARHSYLINKLLVNCTCRGRTNYTSEFSIPTGIRSSGIN